MPSIEDLKKMPATGEAIEIGMTPVDEEAPVVNTSRPVNNGMRVNIGNNNRLQQPIVKKPKTIIGNNTIHASSPISERQELDLSTLPKSPEEEKADSLIKESPMEDIADMVDDYLDDKEEELDEAYATVAQNIEEKKAEEELNNETIDEDLSDDVDDVLDATSDDGEDPEDDDNSSAPKKVMKSVLDDEDDTISDILGDDDDVDEVEDDEETEVATNIKTTKSLDLDDADDEIDDEEDFISSTVVESKSVENSEEDEEIQDDPEKELNEDASVNTREAYLKKLKALATEKLKPAAKQLNLKSFTILRKPTTNISFLKNSTVNVAKWVLPNQESIVLMREYLGVELEDLRRASEDNTSPTSLTRKFRSIYDHIESPKPGTFEAWLKATPYSDIDHYFFGVFIASFQGTNFIPYDCKNDKCRNTFLTDDIKITSMVKFKDKEAEAKFKKIYKSEEVSSTKEGIYVSEFVQISDRIAVVFKEPSVYNVIENTAIEGPFRRKYANVINVIPYIDNIYMIDQNEGTLSPIGYKVYEGNATKTFKSKIQKYSAVFKTLTNDEYSLIQAYAGSVIAREQIMTYQYPEVECPECHSKIEAAPIDAESAVFTRYQLAALVNTTLS